MRVLGADWFLERVEQWQNHCVTAPASLIASDLSYAEVNAAIGKSGRKNLTTWPIASIMFSATMHRINL
jgi:hypothetical protein